MEDTGLKKLTINNGFTTYVCESGGVLIRMSTQQQETSIACVLALACVLSCVLQLHVGVCQLQLCIAIDTCIHTYIHSL